MVTMENSRQFKEEQFRQRREQAERLHKAKLAALKQLQGRQQKKSARDKVFDISERKGEQLTETRTDESLPSSKLNLVNKELNNQLH